MTATMGVLGRAGEYRPRFGLWLTTEPDCQAAVRAILAEGYNFDVVLKFGSKCPSEGAVEPWRPIISAAEYMRRVDAGTLEHCPSCYLREVFICENVNLRRERPESEAR